jgi:predicted glutamine amidotransferase
MTMIKINRTAAMLVIAGVAAVFFYCHSSPHEHYDLQVKKMGQGWGYAIRKDDKPFIYQATIPAIEGNRAFTDKRSAKKTGRLVLSKLQHNQMPSVSIEELKELGVLEK